MPRIGMNPSRNRDSGYEPSRVTLAVLTHVPHGDGYFEHRFDVLRLCIESLINSTQPASDLLVFDNASSPDVVNYLRSLYDAGKIQYLILSSRNIGKVDALQMIFRAAPGEIIAYTDDDVLFLPGWLDAHLNILETYPKVGLVTGFYIRSQLNWSVTSTLNFANHEGVTVEKGLLWDPRWEKHYMENMGRTLEKYHEESRGLEDILFTCNNVKALASAGHHQFVAYKSVLLQALPEGWSGRLMGKMREFDDAIDQFGYLRLNTPEPVTRLLGNVISKENAETARQLGIQVDVVKFKEPSAVQQRLGHIPLLNGLARRLYRWLYKFINA